MPLPELVRLARWRAANARARRIQRAESYVARAILGEYLRRLYTFYDGRAIRQFGMPDKILSGIEEGDQTAFVT